MSISLERRALASLLSLGLALACATPLPTPHESGQLVLWRVARSDGTPAAHLLGTLHVSREALAIDPAIASALAASDSVALELAPEAMQPEAALAMLMKRGLAPPGETLRDLVSWPTWWLLKRHMSASGRRAELLSGLEPWAVFLMLQAEAFQQQGLESDKGVEAAIAGLAGGRPIIGLESLEEQIGALDGLPYAVQDDLLFGQLAAPAGGATLDPLFEAWRLGDLESMEAIFFSDSSDGAELVHERLIFERNERMAERVAQRIEAGGNTFVAVGAGHMLGARGLPSLLARRGYRVERVAKTKE